jgi:hypothetical protein
MIFAESSASFLKRSSADAFCLTELLLVRERRAKVSHRCEGEGVIGAEYFPIAIESGTECDLSICVLLAIQQD